MTRAETPPRIDVAVTFEHPTARGDLPEARRAIRRAATAALRTAGLVRDQSIELSVVAADDALVRRLNHAYRGVDRATNVLAFAGEAASPEIEGGPPVLLGDVVLSFETMANESERRGIPLRDHLCHLVIHGVLHLAGYDHDSPATATAMEGLERRALAELGISDPYVTSAFASAEAV